MIIKMPAETGVRYFYLVAEPGGTWSVVRIALEMSFGGRMEGVTLIKNLFSYPPNSDSELCWLCCLIINFIIILLLINSVNDPRRRCHVALRDEDDDGI